MITQQLTLHLINNHSKQVIRARKGVVAFGCRSSVAEHWQLKPEALGLTPGRTTFLSGPLPFQRSTDSNGPDCVFQLDTIIIGLWTIDEPHPLDSSTAVIMLMISYIDMLCHTRLLSLTSADIQ